MCIECRVTALSGIDSLGPQKNPKKRGPFLAGRLKGLPKVTPLASGGARI